MTQVKMKAIDTLHVSSVGADNIAPGGEFAVDEDTARQLEERGLATRVKAKAAPAAPQNKMEPAPANKAAKAPAKKTPR